MIMKISLKSYPKKHNILKLNLLTIDKSKVMLDLYLEASNGQDPKEPKTFKRK